jgi:hypothetical protein
VERLRGVVGTAEELTCPGRADLAAHGGHLHASGAPEANRHLLAFDDDRDVAAALRVGQHALQVGSARLGVDVLDLVAALRVDLTGLGGVGSGVLAEDEDVHGRLQGLGASSPWRK